MNLKPFVLVIHDSDERVLTPALTQALKGGFSIAHVTSMAAAKTLLRNLIPDCVILDLDFSDAVSTLDHIRSLTQMPPVLAFASPQVSSQSAPGIEMRSKDVLTDSSTLREIVASVVHRPLSRVANPTQPR